MAKIHFDLRNFLRGASGYLAGYAIGLLILWILAKIGVVSWLVHLVDESQPLIRVLAIPIIAGLVITLAGSVLGGVGGWSLGSILGVSSKRRQVLGSAISYGIFLSILTLVLLLLIGFIGIYNNFTSNRVEHYGLVFGLFWLAFGFLTGLIHGLLSLRLKDSWRLWLVSMLGYGLGGFLMGLLVRLVNPTAGFQTAPILTWMVLILALALPFAMGGGLSGFVYGRLRKRQDEAGLRLEELQPTSWQTGIVAGTMILILLPILGLLGQATEFLTIKPANMQTQIQPETLGVSWTEAESFTGDFAGFQPGDDPTAKISIIGSDQVEHIAWCSSEGLIQYQQGSQDVEQIEFPGCINPPALALDAENQPHLVWYTDEIQDINQVIRTENLLVESIRIEDAWSPAAIVSQTNGQATPILQMDKQGNLLLIWEDDAKRVFSSIQRVYECDEQALTTPEMAGLESILNGNTRPEGSVIPYCQNSFRRILYTPNPLPEVSDIPATQNGAFDYVSAEADRNANYEILFTTMQYEPSTSPPSPGNVLAEGVAFMYQKVKANPEKYPRGMTVRILLGNYPEVSNLSWGDQIWDALEDLRTAGVEKMVDPEIGWRLEVANFPGVYPHSHTKFLVVDGKYLTGAGFNYGYLHFPKDHPSGLGYDLFDLALAIEGPAAQDGLAFFDDMWEGANQIHCEDFNPPDGSDWHDTCQEKKAQVVHTPEVLYYHLTDENVDRAYALYRNSVYKEADDFIASSIASAQDTIDMIEVNFSLELICMVNVIFPDVCTIENALPWMESLLNTIQTNQTKVRVIMENTNSNGLENRVSGKVLMDELERLGLEDQVELRFYNGKVHAKSLLIDGQFLFIGSQNMHYSSWGEGGLNEFSVATNSPEAVGEYQRLFEAKWAEAIPFEEAEYSSSP